jgi:hypothetical protein
MTRELVSINGATGTGKSTKLRELLARHSYALAVDPWGDEGAWRAQRFARVGDLDELSKALARSWRRGFRLVLTPPAHLTAEALDRVSHLLFGYSEQAMLSRVALAVDEMAECFSNAHAQSKAYTGFRRIILQGRHINCSVYGVTQRPQDVATQFRANCDRRFFFALHTATARDAVLADIGREHVRELPTRDYEFLEWNRGVISKGRTRR